MDCPYCKSSNVSCDTVDVGIGGEIQCGPYGCDKCHAVQVRPLTPKSELSQIEWETTWHQPPIETAPRDGSMVIVRDKDGKEYAANWGEECFVGNAIDPQEPAFTTHVLLIENLVSWRPYESYVDQASRQR